MSKITDLSARGDLSRFWERWRKQKQSVAVQREELIDKITGLIPMAAVCLFRGQNAIVLERIVDFPSGVNYRWDIGPKRTNGPQSEEHFKEMIQLLQEAWKGIVTVSITRCSSDSAVAHFKGQ